MVEFSLKTWMPGYYAELTLSILSLTKNEGLRGPAPVSNLFRFSPE